MGQDCGHDFTIRDLERHRDRLEEEIVRERASRRIANGEIVEILNEATAQIADLTKRVADLERRSRGVM